MINRFLSWLKSWFVATPKIRFPRLPIHEPWTCPCCGGTISGYTGQICVACYIQSESMKITPQELFQISHQ